LCLLCAVFSSQSLIAVWIVSSANTEQCNFIGGNSKASAISLSLISLASAKVLPFNISTNIVDEAIAEPHPYVLNFTSSISSVSGFNFRSFKWEGVEGTEDQKGDEMSLEAKLPFGITVEGGKRSHDGVTEDAEFVEVTYSCCKESNKNDEFGISDKAYNLTSVANQKF